MHTQTPNFQKNSPSVFATIKKKRHTRLGHTGIVDQLKSYQVDDAGSSHIHT